MAIFITQYGGSLITECERTGWDIKTQVGILKHKLIVNIMQTSLLVTLYTLVEIWTYLNFRKQGPAQVSTARLGKRLVLKEAHF